VALSSAPACPDTITKSGPATDRTIEPCYRYLRALAREGHMNMARRKLLAALGGAVA